MMKWSSSLGQSIMSLVKVAIQSRRPSKLPEDTPEELVILANGPSLNDTVGHHGDFLEGKALLAVNFCAVSPMFTRLRPQFYLIADPLFWIVDEKRESLFGALAEKTAWPMHFFMPSKALKDKRWKPIIERNPNIRLHIYNAVPVEGFKSLSHWLYRHGLGVPRPHNVLIPSIAQALRMPFNKIYLAGADHSWLPEITVTDSNEVLMHQKHFYDRGSSKAEGVKQENLKTARLYTILFHMYTAFKAYFILSGYAESLGKEVINITPGSYIDAFPRMRLGKDGSETDAASSARETKQNQPH